MSTQSAEPPLNPQGRGRRWLVAVLIVVIAGAGAVVWSVLQRDDEPLPAVTSTTTQPAPTPEGDPIEFTPETLLLAQVPGVVRQYALASMTELDYAGGKTEAWQLTYRATAGDLVLELAQWATADAAALNHEDFLGDVGDASGDDLGTVESQGQGVGEARLWTWPDGQGRLVWQNGSVLFRLDGAADELVGWYRAFPM